MDRSVHEVKISSTRTRIRVRVSSDICPAPPESASRWHQYHLLTTLAHDPQLLMCGDAPFQTLTVKYVHDRWVAEAESMIDVDPQPMV
jgi:hypothetical protein